MIKYIVVHCSDSPQGRGDTAATIHRWHQERKPHPFDGIGYHYVILESGEVERGRPYYWKGAHVAGHNHGSIGICLIGIDSFTDDQMAALRDLITELQTTYHDADVVGHRDLDSRKTCPNFDVRQWLKSGELT